MEQGQSAAGRTGLMDKVRQSASSQLGTQKDRATDGIGSVAQAVRQSTQQLRDQRHETIAQYVEQAADQLEQFANRLKNKDIGEMAREAQDFARRRPTLFIGSAFALGICAARFLKSSANNGSRSMTGETSWSPAAGQSAETGWA
jgi:hypothetical protein